MSAQDGIKKMNPPDAALTPHPENCKLYKAPKGVVEKTPVTLKSEEIISSCDG